MGNSASARRRTQSTATSPNNRSPVQAPKQDKLRPRSSSENYIDPSNLAPRKQIESNFPENSECPICFLNYEELNIATCCKQLICTDCYLLMKHSPVNDGSKCPCPFCSNETLNVVYSSLTKKTTSGTFQPVTDLLSQGISSFSSATTLSKTEGSDSNISTGAENINPITPIRNVQWASHVPLSSIDDRRDLETAIQQQRLRYADDRPPPAPPSARSQVNSFSRRNYIGNDFNSEYNSEFGRGGALDFEQAALRMRFGGTLGENSLQHMIPTNGIRRSTSRRMSDQEIISECLEGNTTSGASGIDLERIEEMMMMEAIRQSIASSPSSAMSPIHENTCTRYESAAGRNDSSTCILGGGAVESESKEEEIVSSSKISSSATASAHSQSTTTLKSCSAESESSLRSCNVASPGISDVQSGTTDLSTVQNGNFSDCESDVGASTMAWDETVRSDHNDNSNTTGKYAVKKDIVGTSEGTLGQLPASPKKSLIPEDYRVTRRSRPSSAVPRPLGGRFSEANIHFNQYSPREENTERGEITSDREYTQPTNITREIRYSAPDTESRSLSRTPLNCEERKSEDDSDLEDDVQDGALGEMTTATMIGNRIQSEDMEDSLYGDIESINSFGSEHGGANHFMDNTESPSGMAIGRAVRLNDSVSTADNYGGSNSSEEKDSEEEEEVIILSLVLNPNDGCVLNQIDASYYDTKIFDSALDREDALIYL